MNIEDKLGIYVEPSVQGGYGVVNIYSKDTSELYASDLDYGDFCEEVMNTAISSKNESEFSARYKSMLNQYI